MNRAVVQVDVDRALLSPSDGGLTVRAGLWSGGRFTPGILVQMKLQKSGPNEEGVEDPSVCQF